MCARIILRQNAGRTGCAEVVCCIFTGGLIWHITEQN